MAEESTPRTEHVFVLYGSQTGNSEQAAEDFSKQIVEKFTPSYLQDLGLSPFQVETTCIQLDDFLDYKHAAFSKTMVIFVSSYGVGQAPMGAHKFRSFVEELMDQTTNGNLQGLLKGLSYAICGLGDSGYTTYLKNPTTIDKALTEAGATRIGDMAKADAKQIGANSQENVIAKWKEDIWIPLAKSIAAVQDESVDLHKMQAGVIPILTKIDPDYQPPKEFGGKSGGAIPMNLVVLAVLVAILAALFVTGNLSSA